ncbi:SDR family NAD(P)-dependent oxidoreductase [Methylomonas sp. SURF-2]|uniref:SDR family NAD(P)-dependent oxidoreductase n=1 Tax=Methylomonas subterranea TaxID=2952225 RepID=A0ABT1THE2_9GAMM|nr:SDR family NAD(P)-dependent oxidoreductase [Methylomonas sp. SURF-2]MCQ8104878.1 SDR family NAD(P)-dependent oxidoreductase [Methylomonas sp. SURF-2]
MKTFQDIWRSAKVTRHLYIGPVSLIFHFRRKPKITNNLLLSLKRKLFHHFFLENINEAINTLKQEHQDFYKKESTSRQIAVIVGVGPGFGYSLVEKLAIAGYHVVAVSRDAGRLEKLVNRLILLNSNILAYSCDATDESAVKELFSYVSKNFGVPHLVVYSVQYFSPGRVTEVELPAFEEGWRNNCLGGFLVAREACRAMQAEKRGTILLVGSTSSLFAREDHLNLAVGKFGLRALAQVLAREAWPFGVHVTHLIIDAEIDEGVERNVNRPKANPNNIANSVLFLHEQSPDSWTSEMDTRPNQEKFWEHC